MSTDAPELHGGDREVGVHRVVAVAVLQDDGESVGAELSHQPHLARLHRLHRGPYTGGDADAVPANDAAARQRIPSEAVDDRSLHRPVELAQVGRRDRAGRGHRAAERTAASSSRRARSSDGEQVIEPRLVLLQLGEPALGAPGRALQGLELPARAPRPARCTC